MHFFRINFFLLSGFHCVYGPQLLHPFICRCTSRLLPWSSCCNSAAVNTGAHVSLSVLVSSGCVPSTGITGLYCGSSPSFLRNLHTVLHSGCINLHSSPAVQETSLFSTPSPAFVVCRLFHDGHSEWCEISHCSFDFCLESWSVKRW